MVDDQITKAHFIVYQASVANFMVMYAPGVTENKAMYLESAFFPMYFQSVRCLIVSPEPQPVN